MAWVDAHLMLLSAAVLVTSAILLALLFAEITFEGPVSLLESVFYVQKLAVAAIVLTMLRRWEARLPEWLSVVASYSFAIYFLHGPVQFLMTWGLNQFVTDYPGALETLLLGLVFVVIPIGVSIGVASILRAMLGERSRMIIGT
jgi:probable poly-beta-1,6-N-acetyl-D-glucosamine export protein